jgi:hypothetical protein
MPFYVGLDLGQSADYTALAAVHSTKTQTPEGQVVKGLHLRHLERYPLRTPYPEIVEKVAALVRDERLVPTEYDPSRRATPPSRPPSWWITPGWEWP